MRHQALKVEVVIVFVVVLLLRSGRSLQQSVKVGKTCPCYLKNAILLPKDDLANDTFKEGMPTSVSCCKDILLGYHDPDASVYWSFNGEPYNEAWSSSLRSRYCGNETVESTNGRVTDAGTYSCTVTPSNGTTPITVSMQMTVQKNIPHRVGPLAGKRSPDVVTQVGSNVTFTCESYAGTQDARVTWVKYFLNQSVHTFANMLPNVSQSQDFGAGVSEGMIKGELVISPVQQIHFGIYECSMKNNYNTTSFNMTLTNGVPAAQMMVQRYKTTAASVAAVVGLLGVCVLVWCRWGRLLALYCRQILASKDTTYKYDVFLVHGESVGRWVWSLLLPALEDTFGYSCFLPQRDMCGGDMVAESILTALSRCRRVVVVITPCLLESPWATWATYSGIQSALTSKARILALIHKEKGLMSDPLKENPLLSVLKVVRKIKVPQEIVWETWQDTVPLHCVETTVAETEVNMKDLEGDVKKAELKLIIPEIKLSASIPSTPRSQRLSNMITGSNTASREDLECEKDKTVSDPIMFTSDDHEVPDPGSPNSITPFIIPTEYDTCRSHSNGLICQPVGSCLHVLCLGNPEEKFWQTLRLHLGPPTSTREASNNC